MRTLTALQSEVLTEHYQETYWTLGVVFPEGEVVRVAGTELTIDGNIYKRGIISSSGLVASLSSSADRVELTVENIDWAWTKRARQQPHLALIRAVVGRAFSKIRTGPFQHLILLSGIVTGIPSNRETATIQIISDLYAAPAIGATRHVSRMCQWKYKDPQTCGYTGPEATCNKVFESPDGCAGRNNQHRYGGFIADVTEDTLTTPTPDPGGTPNPGGGGTGGEDIDPNKYFNPFIDRAY